MKSWARTITAATAALACALTAAASLLFTPPYSAPGAPYKGDSSGSVRITDPRDL
ncbi:hypothetical protein [Pseudonocardia lacus]|uniref:hypothetical protein n=1 Tax=Pseudonocardia lacus TaxID=2835865 RepID=UPI001BDD2BF8|nr:hypothetical protein [Pseudonocardia lacus]